jgi:hypothetical protein
MLSTDEVQQLIEILKKLTWWRLFYASMLMCTYWLFYRLGGSVYRVKSEIFIIP